MTRTMKKVKKQNTDQPIYRLAQMLQWKRPAHSANVSWFIEDYIEPVCDRLGGFHDDAGNYIVRVGDDSKVLFSSHTDTVHDKAGMQKIVVNGDYLKVSAGEQSNCLGADDTTGVWLMLEMIRANVKGLYIFHADEEIGGLGSSYIAKHQQLMLGGIDYAIAFDRKGLNSIITHQVGGRCCSDAFADSMARMLPVGYVNDTTGTFTDTANYTDIIPECTNIAVGYFDQHTSKEKQSISHAMLLRNAMVQFDETRLVRSRIAGEPDYESNFYYYNTMTKHSKKSKSYYNYTNSDYYDLYDYVRQNPDIVTSFLEEMGYDISYFQSYYQN